MLKVTFLKKLNFNRSTYKSMSSLTDGHTLKKKWFKRVKKKKQNLEGRALLVLLTVREHAHESEREYREANLCLFFF